MEKGLDLVQEYYRAYGESFLSEFPEEKPYLAVGLCGCGSECFGFDDEISRDHDFEPGFCVFLPSEDILDRRRAFLLERAYAKLPKEFHGVKKPLLAPVGGNRRGILRTEEFFLEKIGKPIGNLTLSDWLTLPEQSLAEATNGELFDDFYGEVTTIRKSLAYLPEDIRKKKLAGELLLAAQSGQYNYLRCVSHGEPGAAQLSVCEFVRHAMHTMFLLSKKYLPYYKWQFRSLRENETFAPYADTLEFLLQSENDEKTASVKADAVEDISIFLISCLQEQNLTRAVCGDLEKHAYSVNDGIENAEVRNLHILSGVSEA